MKQLNKEEKVQNKIGPLKDKNDELNYDVRDKTTIVNVFIATIDENLAYNFPLSQVDTSLINTCNQS